MGGGAVPGGEHLHVGHGVGSGTHAKADKAGGHDGGPLPEGGIKIKKGKLRGVESYGMLCSYHELGLPEHDMPGYEGDGILILGEEFAEYVGKDVREALLLCDTSVEFEITSNRPDCLSVIGLAREAAATFKTELKVNEPVVKAGHGDVNDMLKVQICRGG